MQPADNPQQGQHPPHQGPYPQQQGQHPQQQGPYPSQQGPYPPQQGPYPPQQGPYPPQQGPYPPQQGPYPPQQGPYPPHQGPYPQQQGPYPPQQPSHAPPNFPAPISDPWQHLLLGNDIIVSEKANYAEVLSNLEANNQYDVFANGKEKVLRIKEKTGAVHRNCCGSRRGFKFTFFDANDSQTRLMEMSRKWYCVCCGIVGNNCTTIKELDGDLTKDLAVIRQGSFRCKPRFLVDSLGDQEPGDMKLTGPVLLCQFQLLQTKFTLHTKYGDVVIRKEIKSTDALVKQLFSDASVLRITIPTEIKNEKYGVKIAQIALAVAIVLDMTYFEQGAGNNRGMLGNRMNNANGSDFGNCCDIFGRD
ncbi:MAG: Phospholipid scramblase 1 [Marteilia pararefringens]